MENNNELHDQGSYEMREDVSPDMSYQHNAMAPPEQQQPHYTQYSDTMVNQTVAPAVMEQSFLKAPIRALNGRKNRDVFDPVVHGLLSSFYMNEDALFHPHIAQGEVVYGSYTSEMYETPVDNQGWFRFFWMVIGFFLPRYYLYSLFITSKKIVTCQYTISRYLDHYIDRQDSKIKHLLSVQMQPSMNGMHIYRAKEFYSCGCFSMFAIKFFDIWVFTTVALAVLGFIPIPAAFFPILILFLIVTVPLMLTMMIQAIRMRVAHIDGMRVQRLYKDILCFIFWGLTVILGVILFIYTIAVGSGRKNDEERGYWTSLDLYFYAMQAPLLVCYLIGLAFFPSFGCARYAILTLKFKGNINHMIALPYQDCLEAKKQIEEAMNYSDRY